ncbi:class I SAM-dependent methyltransferase [Cylindrospermopsis raciborskii]|uniref:class I SAM-dependent methyltransferase n=1 Tax=Cylindrospermopsis raciborskii TaxID=77022 RepID=UPI001F0D10A5
MVRDNFNLRILECSSCGLVYLSSFDHIRSNHYEQSGMHGSNILPISDWLKETDQDDERRFRFLKTSLLGKKILDFGCGCGGFLLKSKLLAESVCGVEPENRLQQFFTDSGIPVYPTINDIESYNFDIITAFHVIEHLVDPVSVLKSLSLLLQRGGEIVIEVPNADDALLTLFECEPFMKFTYWSQHLYLFNPQTLPKLIQKAGLKLRWIKQVQRYPLTNHLHWLAKGGPGGHRVWYALDNELLNQFYESQLSALGKCDTLMASVTVF